MSFNRIQDEVEERPGVRFVGPRVQLAEAYFVASRVFAQVRRGNAVVVTVAPILVGGGVYYFWYRDGVYVGSTGGPRRAFVFLRGEQVRLEVLQTRDVNFDGPGHAPTGYPARRVLRWIRSVDAGVERYRLEQQKNGGSWVAIGSVAYDRRRWSYTFLTPRLEDLATYGWRVVPVNGAGNDGTSLSLGSEKVVRAPDAVDFEITFNAGTTRVTFSEGA